MKIFSSIRITITNKNDDLIPHGRAYYPKDKEQQYPRGFLNSHSVNHYGWIFELKQVEDGYIKSRADKNK